METFYTYKLLLIIFSILIWSITWKGYALWIASKNDSKRWFIALLVLNTFSILDIIFIFFIAKKTKTDLIKGLNSKI
jgi:hypothetical protein